jgi:hypothetical protein
MRTLAKIVSGLLAAETTLVPPSFGAQTLPCNSSAPITINSKPLATSWGTPPESSYVPGGYIKTFEDNFGSLSTISTSPIPFSTGVKWYNGIAQCCMSPYPTGIGSMYPTPVYGQVFNPYSISATDGLNISLTSHTGSRGTWWNSGVMQTLGTDMKGFSQKYGYFEIAAQFPTSPGTWPAFWMLPVDKNLSPGEIDIFESYTQFRNGICTTLHDWKNDKNSKQYCFNNPGYFPDVSSNFHVYGLLWKSSDVTVYFDGQPLCSWATPAVMNSAYFLLVDLGIGGGFNTSQTASPSIMKVRYIRAYRAP